MASFCGGFPFNQDDEGYLTLRLPKWGGTDEIPFVSITEDFGDFVHGVLLAPEKYDGKFNQAISVSAKPEGFVTVFEKGEISKRLQNVLILMLIPSQSLGRSLASCQLKTG